MGERKIRVLVAKPGLDGHDRGARVVARAYRDAGMEVIYTGLHQTPEQVLHAAIKKDVDVIGLSILSGAHMTLIPTVKELLVEQRAEDVILTAGGTIFNEDAAQLIQMGAVEAIFTPGTPLEDIISWTQEAVRQKHCEGLSQ